MAAFAPPIGGPISGGQTGGSSGVVTNISPTNVINIITGSYSNSLLPFITISSRGIKNGLSTWTNDKAMFGPDTAGTTTSGIQEAFDSTKNLSRLQMNTWFHFVGGDYYYTNLITISNTPSREIQISGAGEDTHVICANPTNRFGNLFTILGTTNNAQPNYVYIHDITFSSIVNTQNVIMRTTNFSNSTFERVTWCDFTSLTNATSDKSCTAPGLVGLIVGNVNDTKVVLNNVSFTDLATGVNNNSDHLYINVGKFDTIGVTCSQIDTAASLWGATNKYSLGACVLTTGGLDGHFAGIHFYGVNAGIVNPTTTTAPQYVSEFVIESCNYLLASGTASGSIIYHLNTPIDSDAISDSSDLSMFIVSNTPNYGFRSTNLTAVRQATYEHVKGTSHIFKQTIGGNGGLLSNAVDIVAGANITVTPSAALRTFTIASTGGAGSSLWITNSAAAVTWTNSYGHTYTSNSFTAPSFTSFNVANASITAKSLSLAEFTLANNYRQTLLFNTVADSPVSIDFNTATLFSGDTTGGEIIYSLPDASTGISSTYTFKNTGTGLLIITNDFGSVFDGGAASVTNKFQNGYVTIVGDGFGAWYTVASSSLEDIRGPVGSVPYFNGVTGKLQGDNSMTYSGALLEIPSLQVLGDINSTAGSITGQNFIGNSAGQMTTRNVPIPVIIAAQTNLSVATTAVVKFPYSMPNTNYSVAPAATFALAGFSVTARAVNQVSVSLTAGSGTLMVTVTEQVP